MDTVIGPQIKDPNLYELLGYTRNSEPSPDQLKKIIKIFEIGQDTNFIKHLIRQISTDSPHSEPEFRISNLLDKLMTKDPDVSLKEFATEMGYVSKHKMEQQARESGNWQPFLKDHE